MPMHGRRAAKQLSGQRPSQAHRLKCYSRAAAILCCYSESRSSINGMDIHLRGGDGAMEADVDPTESVDELVGAADEGQTGVADASGGMARFN